VKATNPKIVALLVGIVAVATASLYLVKFLTDYSAKTRLDELLSDGRALFGKKQYRDARAKLEECYRKATEGGVESQANESLLLLSRCYTAEADREKAMESWRKVVENPAMNSDHAEALYTLGQLRAAEGSPEGAKDAEKYYKEAAVASPGSRFGELAEVRIANMMMDRDELQGARTILDKLKTKEEQYPELRKARFKLNMKLLFSPTITQLPQSEYYVVKEGDTLDGISKTFETTADLLQESNRVDPQRIQIGKRLKVVTGKFRLKVLKSKNILQLLTGDVVLNEYRIATGKDGTTPAGKFRIALKQKEPVWFRDGRVIPYGDPENVLGTRWMGFGSTDGKEDPAARGIGIHGTDDESSIGKQSSEGCIRLLNREVEELYKIVPIGTEVIIEE